MDQLLASYVIYNEKTAYSRLKLDAIHDLITNSYSIEPIKGIISLNYGVNDVYQINCNKTRYIFRLSNVLSYWKYSIEDYETELVILDYIHQQHNIVSNPIRTSDGKFCGELDAPEGVRYFALFKFAHGKPITHLSNHKAYQYGKTLSILHKEMNLFREEHNQTQRFTHDLQTLYYKPIELMKEYGLSSLDIDYLSSLEDRIITPIKSIPKDSENFSLIHGDYQVRNSHYDEQEDHPVVFDFDYMSYSWRMIDIANFTSAAKFFQTDVDDEFEISFIRGYNEYRKLSRKELSALKEFEIAIGISVMGQVISQKEMNSSREIDSFLKAALGTLKRFVDKL